jgi:lipopolysaccharide export system protein LptA
VRQGARVADGARVVYTPADGKVLLTGPEVVLKDPDRTARGRSVTFHLGDDLILIDGREETRTETIFQGRPPAASPAPTKTP